jgi:hypothetical protein
VNIQQFLTRRTVSLIFFWYCCSNYINKNEIGRTCSIHGEPRNAYKILGGKSSRRDAAWEIKNRWEDNVKINLREMVYEYVI